MNIQGVLSTPWYAMRRSSRWILMVLVVLMVAGCTWVAIATAHNADHAPWALATSMVVSMGMFLVAFVGLAPSLLLAIDARLLRLPALERQATVSVVLYVVMLVLGPGLLIGILGGHVGQVLGALSMGVTMGLAAALLPRVLSFFIWMMPAAFNVLQPTLHLPGLLDPAFVPFSAAASACFAVVSIICWTRAVRSANPYGGSLGAPLITQFRAAMRTGWTGLGGTGMDVASHIRRNPAWLQPRVELRHSGPAHPVNSLRVGLGGLFAPLTKGGRAKQLGIVGAASAFFVLQMVVQAAQRNHQDFATSLLHAGLVSMMMWGVGFGGSMLAVMPVAQLSQRWARQNAELPLLALLPGLGDATRAKRQLLLASLLPPIAGQLALMVLTLVLAALLHASALSTAAVVLTLAGAIAFLCAFILSIIGGRPLGRWAAVGLCIFGYALFSVSILVPMLGASTVVHEYVAWFVAGWGALLVTLSWLALRGWRGLAHRPHAFLANNH